MNKQQMIDLLVVRGVATRDQLQFKSIQQLEQTLDQSNLALIRAEAVRQVAAEQNPELVEAVQSGRLHLAAASEREREEVAHELAEQRHDFLINRASPEELRRAAAQESDQRRQQAQQEFVREQDEAGRRREAALGKPQLP